MKNSYRNLRKAAVLVASLDEPNAVAILSQMAPPQADAVRQAIARLGDVDPAEQQDIIEEFFRIGPLVPDKEPSGIELDDRLPRHLAHSPPTEPFQPAAPRPPRNVPPLGFLHEASAQSLAPFLEREHPQTIAVVVSHLAADRAAEILSGLPAELQIDVARRLVDLEESDPEVLREVERGLESWLCKQVGGDCRRTAGLAALDNILAAADPRARQNILTNLSGHDRPLAARLKTAPQPALSFAELEQLDPASLTVVLHHAQVELLVLALAGAGVDFAERVFDLFPPDEAGALGAALRNLGPTRLSDVEEAQRELAELAHELELRGEITTNVRGRGHLSVAV